MIVKSALINILALFVCQIILAQKISEVDKSVDKFLDQYEKGRYQFVAENCDKALKDFSKFYIQDTFYLQLLDATISSHIELKLFKEALKYSNELINISDKLYPEFSLDLAFSYEKHGEVLYYNNKFNNAINYLDLASRIYAQNGSWEYFLDCSLFAAEIDNEQDEYRSFSKRLYDLDSLLYANKIIHESISEYYLYEVKKQLAYSFCALEDHQKSLECYQQTLNLCTSQDEKLTILFDLGLESYHTSSNVDAIKYYKESMELAEKVYSKKSIEYWRCINNLSNMYRRIGQPENSLPLAQEGYQLAMELYGKKDDVTATSAYNLANEHLLFERYDLAKRLLLQCLSYHEKSANDNRIDLANTYRKLGSIELEQGNHKRSLKFSSKALNSYANSQDFNEEKLETISNMAIAHFQKGDNKKAKSLALNMLKELESYANNIHERDNYYEIMAYTLAEINEFSLSKSVNLKRLSLAVDKYDTVNISNNLSLDYLDIGILDSALFHIDKAIILLEQNKELREAFDISAYIENRALIHHKNGSYNKAIRDYNETLDMISSADYLDSARIFSIKQNMGNSLLSIGDYSGAYELHVEALNFFAQRNSLSSEYLRAVTNLSNTLFGLDSNDHSFELDFQYLDLCEQYFGKKGIEYTNALANISLQLEARGLYDEAIKANKKALKLAEKYNSEDQVNLIDIKSRLAANYKYSGSLLKAESLLKEVIHDQQLTYSAPYNPYIIFSIDELGNINHHLDRTILRDSLYLNALELSLINFHKTFSGLSHDQAIAQKEDVLDLIYKCLNLYNEKSSTDFEIKVFEAHAYINHFLSNEFNKVIDDKNYRFIQRNIDSLSILLSSQIEKSLNPEEVKKKIKRLEQELTFQIREEYTNSVVKIVDIKSTLNLNEAYIDIIRFPEYNFINDTWEGTSKYAYCIISYSEGNDSLVEYILLDHGKELENEIMSNYTSFSSGNNSNSNLKDELSFEYFWKPIADKIGDAKTVYVSLGGVYNNINLNTLYNPETGKYLIEEKDIRIVNSARDFVLMKEREKKQYTSTTSALFGFPDYNGNTTNSVDTTDYLAATRDLDPIWIDSLTRGGMKAYSLPATKVEVEQIAGNFQKNGWKVSTFTGLEASETNIKKEERPRVLHVATHGYFFEDIPMDKNDDRFLGMDRQRVVQDPMLRSGLLLTGANKTLQGEEPKGENGLLSAAEASLLDLSETELVVLSACETGKGEVKNSEGVYGLRKAFSDAGAQNIIMSLWKVDDKVTQEFMSRFYEIWLNDKTSIREAFNKTQLEIKAKYPQPYYWGAFILVGE